MPSQATHSYGRTSMCLSSDELTAVDALDTDQRGGPEPEAITLKDFGRDIPEA